MFNKVLVGFDFSPCSLRAAEAAQFLCQRVGAEMDVVHVQEETMIPVLTMETAGAPSAAALGPPLVIPAPQDEEEGAAVLALIRSRLAERGVYPKRVVLRTGEPARALAQEAEEGSYELLAVGSHGKSSLKKLLLGSVASRVVRQVSCPVLTVPSPEPSDATGP